MKKLMLITAASIAIAAPAAAFAQNAFQGFYAQMATGYQTTKFGSVNTQINNLPLGAPAISMNTEQFNVSTAPFIIGLGYNFALNQQWVLGVGFDYDVVAKETDFGAGISANGYKETGFSTMKVNNRWSFYVAPGYAATKTGLVYGKVGYAQAKATAGDSQSQTLSGWLLGAGWRQQFTNALYGYLEANYMGYGKPTYTVYPFYDVPNANASFQPSANAYNVLVGVGVKF